MGDNNMKYLKQWSIFENMAYENKKITRDKSINLSTRKIEFNPKQISEIDRFLSEWDGLDWYQPLKPLNVIKYEVKDYHLVILLTPIEDDWFLVDVREYIKDQADKSGIYARLLPFTEKYYKCDQMEGLLQLIETKMKEVKLDEVIKDLNDTKQREKK